MLKTFNLKTEHKENPLGIDINSPVLSWQLKSDKNGNKQSAYQIMVASEPELLTDENPDIWDSGQVDSEQRSNIAYKGKKLKSAQRYYWQVRIWDENDQPSGWSNINWWEMGLLQSDDWKADWIGKKDWNDEPEPEPVPYFRKEFNLENKIEKARIFISGLGYYQLFLNGKKIGNRVLDPGLTDYEERVLYSTYDVTEMLETENAIGVELGRGRYTMTTENVWGWHKPPWRDQPGLLLQLEVKFKDGSKKTIISDETWKTASGPTRFDSLYSGEVYDARREKPGWADVNFNDETWENTLLIKGPQGQMKSQIMEPIRIVDTLQVKEIKKLDKDHYVVDFGQMTAGWVELEVEGEKGTEVRLKYGEKLNDDGSVNLEQDLIDDDIQIDKYILKGKEKEQWEPSFSYKGFRYVEIIGYPGEFDDECLTAKVIHNEVDNTESKFECSNQLFNRIHKNTYWSILNNLHSIPTDTPVFEKNGWTGDAQLTAEAAIYNFDMINFYKKWMNDFKDSQLGNGELPPIVPTSDWGYSETTYGWEAMDEVVPAWDAAYILISWWVYQYYGDKRILKNHYKEMQLYLDYLKSVSEDYIVKDGLGDWLEPTGEEESREGKPPEEAYLTSTAYFYQNTKTLAEIADILGLEEDKQQYIELMDIIYEKFNKTFYDDEKNIYESNPEYDYRQTSNVIPLAFDLVPEQCKEIVLENLVDNIENKHNGHLDTGILGTKYILNVLTENGYIETAYTIADQKTYPSWGHWIENGATSLYEAWEVDARSRNHHMYGSIDDWFYKSLAGIKPLTPGFEKIKIKPYLPEKLDSVKAETDTIKGKILAEWNKNDNYFELKIVIPTEAEVNIPLQGELKEKISLKNKDNNIKFMGKENEYIKFRVLAGEYKFTSDLKNGEIVINN